MIEVGVSIVDITPPVGLSMAGFAARTSAATGTHDKLTARALVIDNTALVTVDVIGIDAALSLRVRSRCSLPTDAVTILATHTHGGPVSMSGRLSVKADTVYMDRLETGIVEAIEQAAMARHPARVFGGTGIDPGYAQNRRQANGCVDGSLPFLHFESAQGTPIAILTSYACHPVVLGADNLEWTGDYPHFAREAMEAAFPGVIALFATGCAGDVNTGHSAASSLSNAANPNRSFAMAKTIGEGVAKSVLCAEQTELFGRLAVAEVYAQLSFQLREVGTGDELAEQWRAAAEGGDPIAHIWASWAQSTMGQHMDPLSERCTAFSLCGAQIVAMPGEIFAQTALEIRQSLPSQAPLFVLAYADDNPGYVPHRDAFVEGGYEVDEAHRFYGLGATFAPGSAERLADAGCKAALMAAGAAKDG
jgi:hypothetical protein